MDRWISAGFRSTRSVLFMLCQSAFALLTLPGSQPVSLVHTCSRCPSASVRPLDNQGKTFTEYVHRPIGLWARQGLSSHAAPTMRAGTAARLTQLPAIPRMSAMLKILSRVTRPRYFDYGPLIQIPVVAMRISGVLIWTSDGIALPARRQVRAGVTRDRKSRQ
jgi:hypothetical protein